MIGIVVLHEVQQSFGLACIPSEVNIGDPDRAITARWMRRHNRRLRRPERDIAFFGLPIDKFVSLLLAVFAVKRACSGESRSKIGIPAAHPEEFRQIV